MLVRRHVVCGRTAASSDELTRLGTDKRPFHAGIQSLGQLTARRLLRWDRDCRASGDLQRVEQSGEVLGNRTTQLPFQRSFGREEGMRRYAELAEQVTIDACVCQKPSCRVGAKSLNRGAGDQVRPSIDQVVGVGFRGIADLMAR